MVNFARRRVWLPQSLPRPGNFQGAPPPKRRGKCIRPQPWELPALRLHWSDRSITIVPDAIPHSVGSSRRSSEVCSDHHRPSSPPSTCLEPRQPHHPLASPWTVVGEGGGTSHPSHPSRRSLLLDTAWWWLCCYLRCVDTGRRGWGGILPSRWDICNVLLVEL